MPTVPLTIKIAFALLAVGFIVFVVGFSSPYWYYREVLEHADRQGNMREGEVHRGLWTICYDYNIYRPVSSAYGGKVGMQRTDECWSLLENEIYLDDSSRAAQFFEAVGLILILITAVLLVLCMCVDACKERMILPILTAVFCFAATVSILLGVIIFGADEGYKPYLSWAFGVTIVGGVFFGIAGGLIVAGAILKK